MKGTSEKSTSRNAQEPKAPENEKPKTGKLKLIPEVVIERKAPRKETAKAPNLDKEPSKDKKESQGTRQEDEEPKEDSVPEWRRNAPKVARRTPESKELPFKDVPLVVAIPSGQSRSIEKKQV